MFLRPWSAVAVVALILSTGSAVSQNPAPWDASPFSASPDAIRQAASAISADPQTEATVFLDDTHFTIHADGRLSETRHIVYRVESKEGVGNWSVIAFRWQPWFQKKPDLQARVIEGDGRVVQLDQKTLTDSPSRETSEDTFTDDRVFKGPLPGIAIGSIVEQFISLDDEQPFFAMGSVYRISFGRPVPVLKTRLAIEAPTSIPLKYKTRLLPDVTAEKETSGDTVTVRFEQGKMAAAPDVPELLPSDVPAYPQVEFSTAPSWAAIASAYAKLAEPQIQPENVASLMPSNLTGSRDELIARIVMALHSRIRYTGVEFGESRITPQPPAEVLKRHYGDCKDKAALLVSMLRAAKIPAYLALLSAGSGQDINPDLPGMSMFNHAIVYVPGTDRQSDRWIDATAEYTRIGDLPSPDRGRHALIIGLPQVDLLTTPQAKPQDNLLVEERQIQLSEFGPGKITESSEPKGTIDTLYRFYYGGPDTQGGNKQLEDYSKDVYLADSVSSFTHGDGRDLLTPFRITITMDKAKRASTDLNEAVAAIRLNGLYSRLPRWFFQKPDDGNSSDAASAKEETPRTADLVFEPFITEWRYTVKPAEGFVSRPVPADKTLEMGPARLTQHYEIKPDGSVSGILRFDTGKGRYTVAEAKALRKAIDDLSRTEVPLLYFDHKGMALLGEGKVREALDYDQQIVHQNDKDAMNHIRLAMALLQAGVGDKARAEAELATQLDSKSALAWRTLAWAAQHDAIGQRFGPGFDWKTAEAAYQKAIALEADDIGTYFNAAVVYEYAPDGERYGEHADLDKAAEMYRTAREKYKADTQSTDYANNMLFDLLYARHYAQVLEEIGKMPSAQPYRALAIAATTAQSGVPAGLAQAEKLSGELDARAKALSDAGQALIHLRLYSEAAEILSAGMRGEGDAALRARQVELFRSLKTYDHVLLPANDSRSIVQKFYLAASDGTLADQMGEIFSKSAIGSDDKKEVSKALKQLHNFMVSAAESAGFPLIVMKDLSIGKMSFTAEGDDSSGYRITVERLAQDPESAFVIKEDGQYKIVSLGRPGADTGRQIFEYLAAKKLDTAKKWLDWIRDLQQKGGGEDSLSGPLLPRFWTVGQNPDPEPMKLAAAALLAGSEDIKPHLAMIREARQKANKTDDRTNLDLLLAYSLNGMKDWKGLREAGHALLQADPDSVVALDFVSLADRNLKDWADWEAAANARLARHPNDRSALRSLSQAATAQADFARGEKYLESIREAGKSEAADLNGIAWLSLFVGKVTQQQLDIAQQANMLLQNQSYATLHTLACLYAEMGKTTEARQVILQAMRAASLREPDPDAWYVFGRIYEQYGLEDAALAAYKRVDKPEVTDPESTYALAQAHLSIPAKQTAKKLAHVAQP